MALTKKGMTTRFMLLDATARRVVVERDTVNASKLAPCAGLSAIAAIAVIMKVSIRSKRAAVKGKPVKALV
jgi:hypothetical protein